MQYEYTLRSCHQQLPMSEIYCGLEKSRFTQFRLHTKMMFGLLGSTYICEQTFIYHDTEQEQTELP